MQRGGRAAAANVAAEAEAEAREDRLVLHGALVGRELGQAALVQRQAAATAAAAAAAAADTAVRDRGHFRRIEQVCRNRAK